ncbi:MAG: methylhydantoinase [Rhodospirillaceae bacterium]|nr:methylhydantoinase [Rhodospirillaceae bacterium]
MTGTDPFTIEVIRHGLTQAAEEMSLTVMRAARSPLLREAGDLSSAITDAGGLLIAQGRDIPMHMGVMSFTVQEFLKHVPAERLAPGDVWFLNLPEIGGNHLPDVKAIRPVFHDGRPIAYAVSLAHWADIGGAVPGSYVPHATDAWQEGVRMPPFRLFSAAGPDREKLDMLLANIRGPDEREGDILAQAAPCRGAAERIDAMIARHGVDTLQAAIEALHDRSARQMAEALAALPQGTFHGEDFLDDDGHGGPPAAVRVAITLSNGRARFDFSETDDAVPGPLNTTRFIAAAGAYYAAKAMAGPDIQPNGGLYRQLDIITRPGSLLDPPSDKPVVGGNHETAQRIADAIFLAFKDVLPERLTAGGPTTSGLLLFAGRDSRDRWTTLYEVHGGGEGGRVDRDGMPVLRVHMSNVMNTPVEVIEQDYPLAVERHALRRGSGGDGLHRGGDGLIRTYRCEGDNVSLTTMFERRIVPPYGMAGGEPGKPFCVILERADGSVRELTGKTNVILQRGDRVTLESSGGGGWGRPDDTKEGLS